MGAIIGVVISNNQANKSILSNTLNVDGETGATKDDSTSNKSTRLTKHGKIDRRTLRGQVGWGKNENGEERKRKKRKRKSRKSLIFNQKYINRQKYILQMAAANGVDISNNPTSKSLLSNTLNCTTHVSLQARDFIPRTP